MLHPHPYFPYTQEDVDAMLAGCGAHDIDELYADVPPQLRLKAPYSLPQAMSEPELREYFNNLDSENRPLKCFAGGGVYHHATPAAVESILSRSEFLTAYTPYQPEVSQGTLQYIFEYQSMMCELTGLDVSNASLYDGSTATAEAMLMCVAAARRRKRVLISATVAPDVAQVCSTYARWHGIALDVIPERDGITCRESLREMLGAGDVAGVIMAQPNYYGIVEDMAGVADEVHAAKALLAMNCVASTLAVLRTPGEWGADIAVGDAQSLGMPMNYGGPYLGYMCTTRSLMRKMPGRIVGATTDASGQRVFVLTLQAREQHIRRDKATSNICSNQGIMALHVAAYLSLLGAAGLREINEAGCAGMHRLAEMLAATGRLTPAYPGRPYLNEVLLRVAPGLTARGIIDAAAAHGVLAGIEVAPDLLLVACTEMQSQADIDRYVQLVKSLPLHE
ncbi:MAG: aminomethyl-transferring glycine dehydrogenase subunit GcvPA [Muribaculaceae bacterium]|nr:aminomethyl-transferring glycine dehydrogenase subunit GcvPA [Muribaculaceae bacterium]